MWGMAMLTPFKHEQLVFLTLEQKVTKKQHNGERSGLLSQQCETIEKSSHHICFVKRGKRFVNSLGDIMKFKSGTDDMACKHAKQRKTENECRRLNQKNYRYKENVNKEITVVVELH